MHVKDTTLVKQKRMIHVLVRRVLTLLVEINYLTVNRPMSFIEAESLATTNHVTTHGPSRMFIVVPPIKW